jgi:hypothetical protein
MQQRERESEFASIILPFNNTLPPVKYIHGNSFDNGNLFATLALTLTAVDCKFSASSHVAVVTMSKS